MIVGGHVERGAVCSSSLHFFLVLTIDRAHALFTSYQQHPIVAHVAGQRIDAAAARTRYC